MSLKFLRATHHFFYHRPSFLTYSTLENTAVQGASGSTIIGGKGLVHLPIGSGIKVEAYYTPKFPEILSPLIFQPMNLRLFSRITSQL